MKIIVGLGNPGEKYRQTRHNVGFRVIDRLAEMGDREDVMLVKPETFMNKSGLAVKKLIENWKLKTENLYVVHDDLDIPLGKYKIQLGKGPKVHNGLRSIYAALKTKDFWHVRIGIDNRSQISDIRSQSGEDYVLGRFTREEKQTIDKVIEEVVLKLRETVIHSH